MTLTDARPALSGASEALPTAGPLDALASTDHKVVGRLYVLFGLLGVLLALVLSGLVAIESIDTSGIDLFRQGNDAQTYFQNWSLARTSLLFFGVLPLLLGLATAVVPLQVGAPSIAFPRAATAALWAWLVGAGMHIASIAIDGGLGDPTSGAPQLAEADRDAMTLSVLSLALVVVALLLGTICVVTTIITQRPPGMSLTRVPAFSWSMLVAGGIWLLTLPVLVANLVLVWIDLRGTGAVEYGQAFNVWPQISWVFDQPQVYAFAIPVLGIAAEVVPVAARRPLVFRPVLFGAVGFFGALSFGAFAQRYFNPSVEGQPLYVVMGLLAALPVLVVLGLSAFGLGPAAKVRQVKLSAHLLLGLLALLAVLAAVTIGVVRVIGPAIGVVREYDSNFLADLIDPLEDLQGTVASTSLTYHVLLAALLGGVAGIYYWAPKLFGRTLNALLGAGAGLAIMGGTAVFAIAQLVNGFLDVGDTVFLRGAFEGLDDLDAIEALNAASAVGIGLVIVGVGLVLLDLATALALGRGADPGNDPWGGQTLEWATASPPPVGNFTAMPEVRSATPLLDASADAGEGST